MPTLTNLLEEEQPKKTTLTNLLGETQPASRSVPKPTPQLVSQPISQPTPSYQGLKIEQNKGVLGDIGTALHIGLLGAPSVVTGIADIPFAAAFGRRPVTTAAEFLGEKIGFQPAKKAEAVAGEYTPELLRQRAEEAAAWKDPSKSLLDVAKIYLKNPATIATTIAESAPSMALGGGFGRALAVGAKLSAPLAAGIGEGLVSAGQTMSQAEGEDQRKNALASLTTGTLTAILGYGAGKISNKLGFETFETLIAKGFDRAVRKELSLGKNVLTTPARIAGGAVSESILQELPQSAQEQVFQNYADGKPLWEGVPQAAFEGAVAGFVMGAGTNAIPGKAAPPGATEDTVSEQLLANLIPDSRVKVVDGMATVIRDTPLGPTTITAPVDDFRNTLSTGGDINEIIPSRETAKSVIDEAAPSTEEAAPQKLFERLPETETALKYKIRGTTFQFEPKEGQTKKDLLAGVEGKSDSAAIGWLRRNAQQTTVAAGEAPGVPGRLGGADVVPGKRLFEKLPETETALNYRIRGSEFSFEPKEGQTKADLLEGIKGKSNSAAISWLRRNAEMTTEAAPVPGAPPVAAEELAPAAPAPGAPPVAAEELAPAAPGAPPVVAEELAPAALGTPPVAAEELAPAALGTPPVAEQISPPASESTALAEAGQLPAAIREALPKENINSVTGEPGIVNEADQIKPVSEQITQAAPAAPGEVAQAAPAVPGEVAQAAPAAPGEVAPGVSPSKENITTLFSKRTNLGENPLTVDQVITEAKEFLGDGFDSLVRRNKIKIYPSFRELPADVRRKAEITDDRVAARVNAFYSKSEQKVFIMANKLAKGEVKDYLRHEISHALFREDKKFKTEEKKILDDFAALAGTDESVRQAFTEVPRSTPVQSRVKEALAYWLQNPENQNHNIFKRIISSVKMALRRAGVPVTKLKPADFVSLFNEGIKTWTTADDIAPPISGESDVLYSMVDDKLKSGKEKVEKAAKSLANPKSKLHDLYVQHAPQWLSVTPLNTMVQTFGKTIPQIKSFANHLDAVVAAKTDIVDTAAVKHDTAETLANKKADVATFNRVAATASFNQMTPWVDIYSQEWVPSKGNKEERLKEAQKRWKAAGMQEDTGLTFKQAYEESKKAYDNLKAKDLKDSYIDIVGHLKSIRTRERNNLLAYIESVSEEGSELRENLMNRFNASFSNLKGAYWPLARFGDFILEYVDKEGFRTVRHFPSIAERNAAKDTAIENGVDAATIKEDFKDKQPERGVAIPSQLMAQLSEAVEKKYTETVDQTDAEAVNAAKQRAQDVVNDMNQIWLRWQPETSALKNAIRRKNTKGFSEDMLRSYLDYTQRHASSIAWSEQGRKIDEDINSLAEDIRTKKAAGDVNVTMDRHILNDLRARIQALKTAKVGNVASALGKLGTAYYMTSPSIALVQMSQLGALTYPNLAVKYGISKAAKALSKGVSESFTKKFTRKAMFSDPKVNTLYENIRATVTDENRDTPQAKGKKIGAELYSRDQILKQIEGLSPYQKQLLTLREAMARNLLDISAAHEAYELSRGGNPNSLRSRVFNLAMMPMSLSELTSRKAAILSTKELADQQGKNFFETMSDISDVVNNTLYSYSKEGKGRALQGGISRVLLQFQHYRIMTGIRMALLFKDAIKGESPEVKKAAAKEFVGIMGMTGALAGSLGLPFSQTIFAILGAVLGDEDEPEDYQLIYENWLRENFGEAGAGVAARGLPTLLGADVSRRIGLADIYGVQNEPPSGMHGRDLAAWWAASQLGPLFSVGQGWVQGYDEMIRKGNYLKGLEVASPKPIRDALKSYRVATEGLKTGAGKKILDDSEIGPDEVIMLALGFNADEVAKAQVTERSLRKLSVKISERRGKLIRDAVKALIDGEGPDKALADIRKFNKRMPQFAVTGRDVRPALHKRIKGEFGTTGPRERAIAQKYEIPTYTKQPPRQGSLKELIGE